MYYSIYLLCKLLMRVMKLWIRIALLDKATTALNGQFRWRVLRSFYYKVHIFVRICFIFINCGIDIISSCIFKQLENTKNRYLNVNVWYSVWQILGENSFSQHISSDFKKIVMYILENIYVWQLAMNLIWRKKLAAIHAYYDTELVICNM